MRNFNRFRSLLSVLLLVSIVNQIAGQTPGLVSVGDGWESHHQELQQFDREISRFDSQNFRQSIARANRRWLFAADGGDDEPPSSIALDMRSRELRAITDYESDYAQWRQQLLVEQEAALQGWQMAAQGHYNQIVRDVDPSERAQIVAQLDLLLAERQAHIRRELERLSMQADRLFVDARLSDRSALRYRSEKQNAEAQGQQIQQELQKNLVSGELQNIGNDRYGQPYGLAQGGVEEMHRQLDAWHAAERRLIAERAAWEERSGEYYSRGERQWYEAYQRLEQNRQNWFDDINLHITQGIENWNSLETQLQEDLIELQTRLQQAATDTNQQLRNELERLLELRHQTTRANETILNGIDQLQNRLAVLEERNEYREGQEEEQQELMAEIATWNQMLADSRQSDERVAQMFISLNNSIDSILPTAERTSYDREISYLQRQLDALRHRRDVAQAVFDYAEAHASERGSPQDTRDAHRSAQNLVEQSKQRYQAALSVLEESNMLLGEAGQTAQIANQRLIAARQHYHQGYEHYNDGQLSADELQARYLALTERHREFDEALDEVDRMANAHRQRRSDTMQRFDQHTVALRQEQIAREVREYAEAGYHLSDWSPENVLALRRNQYRQLEERIAVIMRSIAADDAATRDIHREQSIQWQQAQETLLQLRNDYNWLTALIANLEQNQVEHQQQLESHRTGLTSEMARLFDIDILTGSEHIASRTLSEGAPISSIALLSADSQLTIDTYFSGDSGEVAQRYSRDIISWAQQMALQPDELIEQFALAYFYDQQAYPDYFEIPFLLNDDSAFRSLRENSEIKARLQRGSRLPYDHTISDQAALATAKGGGLENIVRFFTQEQGRQTREALLADATTAPLYMFFLTAVGHGKLTLDMNHLAGVIFQESRDFANGIAQDIADHYWNRCHVGIICPDRGKARAITNIRENLGIFDLEPYREDSHAQIDTVAQQGTDYIEHLRYSYRLTDGAHDRSVFRQLATTLLAPPSESMVDFIAEPWTNTDVPQQFPDVVARAKWLLTTLQSRVAIAGDRVAQLGQQIDRDWQQTHSELRQLMSGEVANATDIERLTRHLFAPQALESSALLRQSLDFAYRIEFFDDAGRELRDLTISEVLLARETLQNQFVIAVESDKYLAQVDLVIDDRERWNMKMTELVSVGSGEWESVLANIRNSYGEWQQRFQQDYHERVGLWNSRYTLFQNEREQWLNDNSSLVMERESIRLAQSMGLNSKDMDHAAVHRAIGATELLISDVGGAIPSLHRLMRQALGDNTLELIIDRTRRLSQQSDNRILLSPPPPQLALNTALLHIERDFSRNVAEQMDQRIAAIVAVQIRESVDEARRQIEQGADATNRSTERKFAEMLQSEGYRRQGNQFSRRIIIDRSLFGGYEYEINRVAGYRHFVLPQFRLGINLSIADLRRRSATEIRDRMNQAMALFERYRQLIFGDIESGKPIEWQNIDDHFRVLFQQRRQQFQGSVGYAENQDIDGLFPIHIGYAPKMRRSNPEEIEVIGWGETGRIVGRFLRNEARRQRGYGVAEMPGHRLRMWDDDRDNDGESDGPISAPSLSDATGLLVSVLAGPVGSLVHGAVVAGLDLFSGADASSVLLGLGKQVISAGVGAGLGGIFSAVDVGMLSGIDLAVAQTAVDGGQMISSNLVHGVIDSVELNQSGGLAFNGDRLANGLIGRESLATLAGGLGGSLVGTGLAGGSYGFSRRDRTSLHDFSSLGGDAASAAISTALSGTSTLNLFSTADLTALLNTAPNAMHDSGLLRLQLGGDDSPLSLGDGGYQLGVARLNRAVDGFGVWRENRRIIDAANLVATFTEDYDGIRDPSTALRMQYSSREHDQAIYQQYQRLLAGRDRLLIGIDHAQGETTSSADGRLVALATLGSSQDYNSQLQAGVRLGHEAYRDGQVDDIATQQQETLAATLGHTMLAARLAQDYGSAVLDETLRRDLKILQQSYWDQPQRFASYVEATYDGSEDYWRLTEEGEIAWDGSRDLTDWNGHQLIDDQSGSMSQAVVRYLGLERATELLGGSLSNWDIYDAQTLQDVLNLDRQQIAFIQRFHGSFYDSLDLDLRQKLAGEALMMSEGMRWENRWIGGEEASFLITDQPVQGTIYLSDRFSDGEYERFTVEAVVARDRRSYRSSYGDPSTQGLDRLEALKRDLNGEVIERHVVTGLQTVDIYDTTDRHGVDRDQSMVQERYGTIQGNTLAVGKLQLQVGAASSYAGSALLVNNATTISGHFINDQGINSVIGGGRWLMHSNRSEDMSQDYNNKRSDGCLIPATIAHLEFMNQLEEWGLKSGYNIVARLEEFGQF